MPRNKYAGQNSSWVSGLTTRIFKNGRLGRKSYNFSSSILSLHFGSYDISHTCDTELNAIIDIYGEIDLSIIRNGVTIHSVKVPPGLVPDFMKNDKVEIITSSKEVESV